MATKKVKDFGFEKFERPSVQLELELDDDNLKFVEKTMDEFGFLSKGEALRYLLGKILQDKQILKELNKKAKKTKRSKDGSKTTTRKA